MNLYLSYGFIPLVNRPTRATLSTISLIDVIFSTDIDGMHQCLSNVATCSMSDHFLLLFSVASSFTPRPQTSNKYYSGCTINPTFSRDSMIPCKTSLGTEHSNSKTAMMPPVYFTISFLQSSVSVLLGPTSNSSNDWITPTLLSEIKIKNGLCRKYRRNLYKKF